MKKPLLKDYCTPFTFNPGDKNLVSFDSKAYAKAAAKYIEYLEAKVKNLTLKLNKTTP